MKLYIDPGACFAGAFVLLAVPIPLLIQWMAAVVAHESGHVIASVCLGGRIRELRVGVEGLRIQCSGLERTDSAVCVMAGPLCGMLPILFWRVFPGVGLFALVLTAYNLLPFFPLDGGRLLGLLVPENKIWTGILWMVKWLTAIFLCAMAVRLRFPMLMIPVTVFLREIFLAKKGKKGYNSATIEMR